MRILPACCLLLAACSPYSAPRLPAGASGTSGTDPDPFVTVAGEPTADDVARFLAGRPVRHGSGLSRIQQSGEYRRFAAEMASRWRVFAAKRINHQRDWAPDNLDPLIGKPDTLLYPFGGPDLLYAVTMFPRAATYVLLGLEPAGGLPDLENRDPGEVTAALGRLGATMNAQLRYGYFVTKDMRSDLTGGPLPGVTPVFLADLALLDATVSGVQPITAAGRPGVEIRFRLPEGRERRAIYVAGDLSNAGFDAGYQNWLSSHRGGVAYFKAASYLMHQPGFSGIRDWVLGNCRAVVQDDSGIPFRHFDTGAWKLNLYGVYQQPIALFAEHVQPDLRAAYAAGGAPPLPFGTGYHIRGREANLLVATRR